MKFTKPIISACVLMALATPGYASNFSYTYVEVALGHMTLDEELLFDGDVHEDFGAFGVNGGYQVNDNFALQLTSVAKTSDEYYTDVTETTVSFAALMPFAIADKLDMVPFFGYVGIGEEWCYDSYGYSHYDRRHTDCETFDESGLMYGIKGRFWAVPGRFELNAGVTGSDVEGLETVYGVGGAFWFAYHHSIRANYEVNDYSTTFTAGYAFTW